MSAPSSSVLFVLAACRPNIILGEYTAGPHLRGNFRDLARTLLLRAWSMPQEELRTSFDVDGYTFVIVSQRQLTVLLLHRLGEGDAEAHFGLLQRLFRGLPSTVSAASLRARGDWAYYTDDAAVAALIKAELASTTPSRTAAVAAVVSETTALMQSNVALVLERGDKLEHLVVETDKLEHNASMFAKQSRRLKCALIRKNMKLFIILIVVAALLVVLVAYVIAAKVFCGGWDLELCVNKNTTATRQTRNGR